MKKKLLKTLNILSGISCLFIIVILTLEFGFKFTPHNPNLFINIHNYLIYYLVFDIFIRLIFSQLKYFLTHPTDLLILIPIINFFFPLSLSNFYFTQITLLIIMLGRLLHIQSLFKHLKFKPPQMLILGFLFAIFIGSILLSLPIATTAKAISYSDAIFTATSAICVTGLVINDIGTTFTTFGLVVIMILIQIGGLGIMALSVFLAKLLNRKMSTKETSEFQESYATVNISDSFQVLKSIFLYTFLFEIIGACLLFLFWHKDFTSTKTAIFSSIFHSISAFCNAGFSLFSDSFVRYATFIPVILVVTSLIIIGGIGFPVMADLGRHLRNKRNYHLPLKLQTKIVLTTTLLLIVLGAIIIFASEYHNSLANYSLANKSLVAYFQSVTTRTAGFNTIDLNYFRSSTLFLLIILMYIGASPGSTGGGIKTSTFSLILLRTWNTLRSKDKANFAKRTISNENTLKALSIIFLSAITISVVFFIILTFENHSFLANLFETVSAFGTVGLSLGITKDLSNVGRIAIMILMFIGRLGPLTIAFALSRQKPKTNYSYPEENVLIA
jgi:trk system potassium uptake protein